MRRSDETGVRWGRAVLAVVASVLFWMLWSMGQYMAYLRYADVDQAEETGSQVLWTAVPQLFASFVLVLIATLIYGRARIAAPAGAAVVLAFPVGMAVVSAVLGAAGGDPVAPMIAQFVTGLAGAAAAYLFLRPKRRASSYGY
ncbi:hypothetical protein CLV63_108150 [Murinocardiopsis flavida]|uniref:Uncharacterized protein n=1 Tax=Murinocardiopsis flavida TaxID=645275 RepID=A0A2P8DJN3_9ACTN|nr:hypothetical protein [Murinocardiopsis flavida]PSK97430.1 hypothetical protein CLV63_108150 [Murinocardiopsis flavida]